MGTKNNIVIVAAAAGLATGLGACGSAASHSASASHAAVATSHSAPASHAAVATSHPAVATSHSAPASHRAIGTSSASAHSNVAACTAVQKFNTTVPVPSATALTAAAKLAATPRILADILKFKSDVFGAGSASASLSPKVARDCSRIGVSIWKAPATATHQATGNVVALKMVRSFDMKPAFQSQDFTTQAWTDYIAQVETASGMATDQTLSADILEYYNDLQWNGGNAYNGQALTTLINYGRAVYHINVFPGG